MWNLDKWDGLARTTYVLDGSTVTQATVDGLKTVTGSGAVTVPSTVSTAGGQVRLGTGATAGTAGVTFPRAFAGAAVKAVVVDVQGIAVEGLRPTFRAQLAQGARRAGVLFDELGAHVTADGQSVTVMGGNMTYSRDGACGVLVDADAGTMQGHYGYSVAQVPLALSGTWSLLLSNETKDSPNYKNHVLGVRSASLTLIWDMPGGHTTTVL